MAINLNITVPDQPGNGGGGPTDPPPSGGTGTTVTDTATWQGVTFSLKSGGSPVNCTVGYLASGMPFFIDPGFAVDVEWSPNTTTVGGLIVNGAMKNPVRGVLQGWDARDPANYSNTVRQASPASMRSNDSLVVQTHNPDTATNGGTATKPVFALSYSAILCLAATPANHSYIPASGPYSNGGTARPVYTLDVTTLTFPSYSISSSVNSMATVLASMGRYNPAAALMQNVETRRRNTPAGVTTADGYGQDMARAMAHAGVRLIGNDSAADKQTLARHMMMHFAECYTAVKTSASKWSPDGGQNQGLILPVILGLGWTGDTTGLSTLAADIQSNELAQSFRIDATLLSKIRDPHNNTGLSWPQTTLRRTITNVSGTTLTFSDGVAWLDVMRNTQLVRESDGATARVTAVNATAKTMTIDVQPGTPFAVGNVCFNRAAYSQSVGDEEWTLKGTSFLNWYTPDFRGHDYRNLNDWDGQVLCAMAWGFVHSAWNYWPDYVARVNAGGSPPAPDTYPNSFSSAGVQAFWETHWPTISAVPQTVG